VQPGIATVSNRFQQTGIAIQPFPLGFQVQILASAFFHLFLVVLIIQASRKNDVKGTAVPCVGIFSFFIFVPALAQAHGKICQQHFQKEKLK